MDGGDMLYTWYKIAYILISHSSKNLPDINDEISISFRVRLLDCDGFRIMSGFQFPLYMYLSSWALGSHVKFPKRIITKGWSPIAVSQKYISKKPLKLWSKFTVKVSFAGWEEKWFYHQHLFTQNGNIHAIGATKFAIWGKRRTVPIKRVFEEVGYDYMEKQPAEWILQLFIADKHIINNIGNSLIENS